MYYFFFLYIALIKLAYGFRVMPIFTTSSYASEIDALFTSGRKYLEFLV